MTERDRSARPTYYESWMAEEGIPIHRAYGIADVSAVELAEWARVGAPAAFVHLHGMEGFSGMQVVQIPPRRSLEQQRHLYQQYVVVVSGRGAADVWFPGEDTKVTFEWQEGSFFAIPLNCSYVLHNTSAEPAVYMAVNDAPMVLDLFHNDDFVFNNDYRFTDRFSPTSSYYSTTERYQNYFGGIAETNFIADINKIALDSLGVKGAGVQATVFEMAENTIASHITSWPVGRYHKAHHHLGGAVLYGLRSTGYVLIWPQEAGNQPYAAGNGDRVERIEWGPRSVYSPPSKWFHQHFNTGPEVARQLAFRGGVKHPTGIRRAGNPIVNGRPGVLVSAKEGGSLLGYEDEDPQIRKDYLEALSANGVAIDMAEELYGASAG
jgi:mannose-6-phosphate isomerase-like protein (cupin superfamily)